MQYSLVSDPLVPHQAQSKPHLGSYDPSPEFSLSHWVELIRLVENEDREPKGYVFDDACLHISE
ncbi:MAG: hypothetical protein ABSE96_19710 [Terracidiphilus sp.]|jgi:hypothetical protein